MLNRVLAVSMILSLTLTGFEPPLIQVAIPALSVMVQKRVMVDPSVTVESVGSKVKACCWAETDVRQRHWRRMKMATSAWWRSAVNGAREAMLREVGRLNRGGEFVVNLQ